VRATLYLADGTAAVDPGCAPPEAPPISTCSEDLAVAAMTSPIWLDRRAHLVEVDKGGAAPKELPHEHDPDEKTPLAPHVESPFDARLPDLP
jgi:hypothetical protein